MNWPHGSYRGNILLSIRFLFWKDIRMDWKAETNEEFEVNGVKKKRQKCNVFTRVMGYLRPVSHYNIWKKTEFYSRKYFKEWYMCKRDFDRIQSNRDFISKFSTWNANLESEAKKTSTISSESPVQIDLTQIYQQIKSL